MLVFNFFVPLGEAALVCCFASFSLKVGTFCYVKNKHVCSSKKNNPKNGHVSVILTFIIHPCDPTVLI